MFSEDDLLPLSGLQHMAFCERRWALVQLEAVWDNNRFTAEGTELHERAHSGEVESRPGVLIRRTLPICSRRLGLSGQADIVEFQPVKDSALGIVLPGRRGRWRPYPIEYKRRRDRAGSQAYRVQLGAQALCLEEMFGIVIEEGAIYDGAARRYQTVHLDQDLRELVENLAVRMHELFRSRTTPRPVLMKACRSCSLHDACQPERLSQAGPVEKYLLRAVKEHVEA